MTDEDRDSLVWIIGRIGMLQRQAVNDDLINPTEIWEVFEEIRTRVMEVLRDPA